MKQHEPNNSGRTLRIPSLVVVGLISVATSSVVVAQSNNAVAERLRALEDRAAIEQLITSDYSTALDTHDLKALAALFTDDADFRLLSKKLPPKEYKGRAAIEKAMAPPEPRPNADKPPGDMPSSMKHVITNPRVRLDGDRATATSYWMEVGRAKDGSLRIGSTGYYGDVLKRDNGGWKFQSREVFAYEMPVIGTESAASPPPPTQR